MSRNKSPDPRFKEFTEEFDQNKNPLGFKIAGCEHFFKYEADGGWKD